MQFKATDSPSHMNSVTFNNLFKCILWILSWKKKKSDHACPSYLTWLIGRSLRQCANCCLVAQSCPTLRPHGL